jgi:hypothetical protein
MPLPLPLLLCLPPSAGSLFCLPSPSCVQNLNAQSFSLSLSLSCSLHCTVLYLLYCTYCTYCTALYLLYCTYCTYCTVLTVLYCSATSSTFFCIQNTSHSRHGQPLFLPSLSLSFSHSFALLHSKTVSFFSPFSPLFLHFLLYLPHPLPRLLRPFSHQRITLFTTHTLIVTLTPILAPNLTLTFTLSVYTLQANA